MQLTKTKLEEIAEKLTEKSKAAFKEANEKLSEAAYEVALAHTPKEVVALFKKMPAYFNTTRNPCFDGNGLSHTYIYLSQPIPSSGGYLQRIDPTKEEAKKLVELERKQEKAKEKYKLLYKNTLSALLALKTVKRISEAIPQAIPYLPNGGQTKALVPNLSRLKEALNNQP